MPTGGLLRSIVVTVELTAVGTLFSLSVTALGAYALSRRSLPGTRLLRVLAFLPLLVNAGLIPLYLTVRRLGLVDTFGAMVLPFSVNLIFLHVMIHLFASRDIRAFEDSARTDGAGAWRVFAQIVVPIFVPAISKVALFYGVAYWNSWFPAFIFVSRGSLYPMQMIVQELALSSSTPHQTGIALASAGLLATE